MPKSLKLYIAGLVATAAVVLVVTSLVFPVRPAIAIEVDGRPGVSGSDEAAGLAFWCALTLFASALPVRMPQGLMLSVFFAPVLAATNLGGPAAGGWVAALGTTELREIRGSVPWYGTLANHASIVIATVAAGWTTAAISGTHASIAADFVATMLGALLFFALNLGTAGIIVALRFGRSVREVIVGDARGFAVNLLALAPVAWLMARTYTLPSGWWATLLFALPLYTTRVAYQKFVEMREMFTQTIGALAEAVDKRDPFTSRHSLRVREIAVDIGREMRVSEAELEALEWGGLLHDVGKIGVPDRVLLKQDRLTREERMIMNAHPVLGEQIIKPVTKLARELPIIRHHHEWFNGSGYPDRLIGHEIPKLARILHVADAFEAMTAARPYRLTPLTPEQAIAELRKFSGIQFDPEVVDAFVRTRWAEGLPDPGRPAIEPRPIPLLAQAAGRLSQAASQPPTTTTPPS